MSHEAIVTLRSAVAMADPTGFDVKQRYIPSSVKLTGHITRDPLGKILNRSSVGMDRFSFSPDTHVRSRVTTRFAIKYPRFFLRFGEVFRRVRYCSKDCLIKNYKDRTRLKTLIKSWLPYKRTTEIFFQVHLIFFLIRKGRPWYLILN